MMYIYLYGGFFIVAWYLAKRYPDQDFRTFKIVSFSLTVLSLYQWYSENYLDLSEFIRSIEYYVGQATNVVFFAIIMITFAKAIRKNRQRDGG